MGIRPRGYACQDGRRVPHHAYRPLRRGGRTPRRTRGRPGTTKRGEHEHGSAPRLHPSAPHDPAPSAGPSGRTVRGAGPYASRRAGSAPVRAARPRLRAGPAPPRTPARHRERSRTAGGPVRPSVPDPGSDAP
ncbi:hypothetical protein AAW14_02430 [Streptomyces hygroscopicus]|nr:hypothetical protein [Streptomyces hygroscopicus]